MSPTITPCTEMWFTRTSIGIIGNRDFGNPQVIERGFHDHFGCKLHPRRMQLQRVNCFLTEAAQATMKVTNSCAKQDVANQGQDRVAEPAMQQWHGIR